MTSAEDLLLLGEFLGILGGLSISLLLPGCLVLVAELLPHGTHDTGKIRNGGILVLGLDVLAHRGAVHDVGIGLFGLIYLDLLGLAFGCLYVPG
jgi:hypothetical protein